MRFIKIALAALMVTFAVAACHFTPSSPYQGYDFDRGGDRGGND